MLPDSQFDKYKGLLGKLTDLGRDKNMSALQKFAIMHQTDQEKLTEVATSDIDYTVRALAVEKLVCEDTLFGIAQSDVPDSIKKIAISKISDRKKLLLLRLSEAANIQQYIFQQQQRLNTEKKHQ